MALVAIGVGRSDFVRRGSARLPWAGSMRFVLARLHRTPKLFYQELQHPAADAITHLMNSLGDLPYRG